MAGPNDHFYYSPNQACWSPCTSIARPKSANLTAAFFFWDASNKFSGLTVNNWLKVTCNINQWWTDSGCPGTSWCPSSNPHISESQSKQYWNTLQHWWLKVIWKYWSLIIDIDFKIEKKLIWSFQWDMNFFLKTWILNFRFLFENFFIRFCSKL